MNLARILLASAFLLTSSLVVAEVVTNYPSRSNSSGSASSTPPGGSTTNVQYNNDGSFAGDANFTYTSATGTVSTTALQVVSISGTGGISMTSGRVTGQTFLGNSTTTPSSSSRLVILQAADGPNSGISIYNLSQSQSLRLAMDSSSQPCLARGGTCSMYLTSSGIDVRSTVSTTGVNAGGVVTATTVVASTVSATQLVGPNATKAWAVINGNGSCTVTSAFNVASCSRISAGYYGISFTAALANANYAVNATPIGGSVISNVTMLDDAISPTTAGFVIRNINLTSLTAADSGRISVEVMGTN